MASYSDAFLAELNGLEPSTVANLCDIKVKTTQSNKVVCFSPFREEKTPSLHITDKGNVTLWKDFGSGAGGDVIGLYRERTGLGFQDAVLSLAQKAGIQPQYKENGKGQNHRGPDPKLEKLKASLNWAAEKFKENQKHILAYLESRGFNQETAEKWCLGYALDEWQGLSDKLTTPEQINIALESGIVHKSDRNGRIFDFFRDRITFPIVKNGRVVAIGGRLLKGDGPKYLNTKNSAVFNKSDTLYGFDNACKIGGSKVFVVEGYFDVIALDKVEIPAVATCGTALTEQHIKSLMNVFDEIVFCFDGDKAGTQAKNRSVDMVLPYIGSGKGASFITLPDGKDPDELVREGNLLPFDMVKSLSETIADGLLVMSEAEILKALVLIGERFSKIKDSLQRAFLVSRIAQNLGMPIQDIKQYLK